jgi:hypothetical protein
MSAINRTGADLSGQLATVMALGGAEAAAAAVVMQGREQRAVAGDQRREAEQDMRHEFAEQMESLESEAMWNLVGELSASGAQLGSAALKLSDTGEHLAAPSEPGADTAASVVTSAPRGNWRDGWAAVAEAQGRFTQAVTKFVGAEDARDAKRAEFAVESLRNLRESAREDLSSAQSNQEKATKQLEAIAQARADAQLAAARG